MRVEDTTHAFETFEETYDHMLRPETLKALNREVRVIDGNIQAIRLGERWRFKNRETKHYTGSKMFLWSCDGETAVLYTSPEERSWSPANDEDFRATYDKVPLAWIIETGMRVTENLTGRVIGYAKRPQTKEVES